MAARLSRWLTLALFSSGLGLLLGPLLLTLFSGSIERLSAPPWVQLLLSQGCFELGLVGPALGAAWVGKRWGWLQNPWDASALLLVPPTAERLVALRWGEPFLQGWGWHGLAVGLLAMLILGLWPQGPSHRSRPS